MSGSGREDIDDLREDDMFWDGAGFGGLLVLSVFGKRS